MIVAIISAFFLVALGLAAKGLIVQALVVFAAWLTKNILLLGFFQTSAGKKTARSIRGSVYARLNGKGRRLAYRTFGFVSRAEQATLAVGRDIVARHPAGTSNLTLPLPPQSQSEHDKNVEASGGKNEIPVEDMLTGIWHLGKQGASGLVTSGRRVLLLLGNRHH